MNSGIFRLCPRCGKRQVYVSTVIRRGPHFSDNFKAYWRHMPRVTCKLSSEFKSEQEYKAGQR